METQVTAQMRNQITVLFPLLPIALMFIAFLNVKSAVAGESIRLVNLGEDRNLVARTSVEGVVLHFMGKRSSPDDRVVLLPNKRYVADVRWLAGAGTVVVAAGPGEVPVDVYGFDSEGRRIYRRRSRQEDGVNLHALPGDSLVVVSNRGLAMPLEVLNAGTGEWLDGYLSWPWDRRDHRRRPKYRKGDLLAAEGGLVVMADRSETRTMISLQNVGKEAPIWEVSTTTGFTPTVVDLNGVTSLDSTLSRFAPKEPVRPIAAGTDWSFLDVALSESRIILAGKANGNPVVISFDRGSGQILAATRLPGQFVTLVTEARGDRLLAIVDDGRNCGHLLVLDQSTLEFLEAVANPGCWFVHTYFWPRVLSTRDGRVCLVPNGIGGPVFSPALPRSLVVTWDEDVGVHWLDEAADLTEDGNILVARRRNLEGGVRDIRVEEWKR